MLGDIERLLRETGQILLDRRGSKRLVEHKSSHVDLVTDADRAAEAHLLRCLADLAPDDSVISEESGFTSGRTDRTWVLDPLDGTTNYVAGLDDFGVIIGVMDRDQPVAGGMFLPALDLLYLAESGGGATRNHQPVHVSRTPKLADAFLDHSLAYLPGIMDEQRRTLDLLLPAVRAIRCNHSLRYIGNVVDGTYDGFVYHSLWLWDLVGPSVLLNEAGASVTDIEGGNLRLEPTEEAAGRLYGVLAANPGLHTHLTQMLNNQT
jgi:myo-inositol-1(or 4)-monophosphatase